MRAPCLSVIYLPAVRSFVVETKCDNELDILYCPWCGTRLPKDLVTELTNVIYQELSLSGYEDPLVPQEFKTDMWWKRRGL
jgi:hypothetical protein